VKVLLFGSNGQVGSACRQAFEGEGFELIALTRSDADFSDPESVYEAVIKYAPGFVINACAYTAVDKAESEPELAHKVNALSVASMAKVCNQLDIPCIHISTDYVFDGSGIGAYSEASPVAPLGVYGVSKFEGERLLQAEATKCIILRTSWVFGVQGNNFVKTMVRLGRERDELGVVGDQRGCPTFAGDIAAIIYTLVEQYRGDKILPWGVYHCSNSGECSWYDFAQAIFTQSVELGVLSKTPKLNAITTDQYPTPAKRPVNSVLDCRKLENAMGQSMRHWREGLKQVCASLL
jgi:dTDP-4-dehydrorhamnose reductase